MKRHLFYFVLILTGLLARAQDAEEPAESPKFGIHVYEGPGRDRVAIGQSVHVKEGEVVKDLVVILGSATVDGKVTGDFVVVAGSAKLGSNAVVARDLVVVAGALEAHPNAKIGGERTVVGGWDMPMKVPAALRWVPQWVSKGLFLGRPLPHQYAWAWVVAAFFILLYLLLALLFPGPIRASVEMLQTRPGNSLLTGLLAFLLIGPLLMLLLITVVGSILIPFLLCGALAAYFFGKAVVYAYAGQQISGRQWQSPLLAVLIGAILFTLLYAVPVLGFLVWGVAAPLGVGAVLLAFFRRVRSEKPKPPTPEATPPPPPGSTQPVSQAPPLSMSALPPHAGFWFRLLGTVIDAILIGTICKLIEARGGWIILIWTIYHIAMWAFKGATIGGLIIGTRIVRTDGGPIDFSIAVVRSLAAFLSAAALFLGFFWAGWSAQKQSWHDIIAGTFVVKTGRAFQAHPIPAPANANQ